MELAARPLLTAAVAVSAAGLLAVAPVTPALPEVSIPDIELTAESIFQPVLDAELALGNALWGTDGWILALNGGGGAAADFTGILGAQWGFANLLYKLVGDLPIEKIGEGPGNVLNGALTRFFDTGNMLLSGSQQGLNGLLGFSSMPDVANPLHITNSLLLDGFSDRNLFHSGNIGGLEGALASAFYTLGNLNGLINANLPFPSCPAR